MQFIQFVNYTSNPKNHKYLLGTLAGEKDELEKLKLTFVSLLNIPW